ncbi:hypothetical protein HPB50_023556 [Hyalomma asiaticum]|uniref:Uncharacterized protein n=1 Tax=Hyalomma asiaticum TaxID=266040 RepID=A0ACB7S8Y9_HYAAI|nr:hypothetical protein HPB50_023556 [Hyalomma asiaticum]
MIKKKVKRRASSDDIAVTRLHVSLRCPLSRTRMTVPCRARSCNHLDCFDAYSYLQVNERRPVWMCPVCGKRAAFSSLVIDQMFEHIVANTPGDCDGVVFHEDGSVDSVAEGKRQWRRDTVFVRCSQFNAAFLVVIRRTSRAADCGVY